MRMTDLQAAVVERLADAEFFTPTGVDPLPTIPVLSESDGDILATLNTELARIGGCVLVALTSATVSNPNVPGPELEAVEFACICQENPVLNRSVLGSGVPAVDMAEAVARLLHLWTPTDMAPLQVVGVDSLISDDGMFSRTVRCKTRLSLYSADVPERAAIVPGAEGAPMWTGATGNVRPIDTLPEAETLDGSELVPIMQGGVTVRVTASQIADLLRGDVEELE